MEKIDTLLCMHAEIFRKPELPNLRETIPTRTQFFFKKTRKPKFLETPLYFTKCRKMEK